MKNEANKEDVLSDLYALRAGLSVISQCADELSAAEEERETKPLEIIKSDGLDKLENQFGLGRYFRGAAKEKPSKKEFQEWLKTDDAIKSNQGQKEQCQTNIIDTIRDKKRNKAVAITFVIVSIISLLMFIMSFVLIAVGESTAGIVLFPLGGGLSVISVVICIWMKGRINENYREIRIYQDMIKDKERIEKNLYKYRKTVAQIEEETTPIIANAKETYKVMYPSLLKTFNKVLDERDWKYVDLIIYYFETGRADDMKEALHLLEKEIQTNRIIGVIADATECICATVERVATRISVQLGVISSQLSQIAELQQIQVTQNSELISQTKMQNALIAKSNVSSEKLMQDVKYIKGYCKK